MIDFSISQHLFIFFQNELTSDPDQNRNRTGKLYFDEIFGINLGDITDGDEKDRLGNCTCREYCQHFSFCPLWLQKCDFEISSFKDLREKFSLKIFYGKINQR